MKRFPFILLRKSSLAVLTEQVSSQRRIIERASNFVKEIEAGNLDTSLGATGTVLEEDDSLSASLESMRRKLKTFSLEEKQRHWVNEGLAKFVDILKSGNDITTLADEILRNLVKYLGANQGALYILNEDNVHDRYLEMAACYAYDRKKHLEQRIQPGEGITGQVFLEKCTTYLNRLPDDFVKITSGLGEALPKHLVVVPLCLNEDVLGIVELASFQPIEPYQINFVETIGENIASSISAARNIASTTKLLKETQLQTEQMRSVEEEMRQNMEELTATQEEMTRAQQRTQAALLAVSEKEAYLMNMLNASHEGIFTVDKDYKAVLVNNIVKKTFKAQGLEIGSGFNMLSLAAPGQEKEFKAPYIKAFNGEVVELERKHFDHYFQITYNPIVNTSGDVVGVSVFTKDITDQKKLQEQSETQRVEEQRRAAVSEHNREVLKSLVKNADIQNGNLPQALEVITRALGQTLGVTRAAVWSYHNDSKCIRLEKMFSGDSFVAGAELFEKDIPNYFASIKSEEVIVAMNTFDHPALIEFQKGYLDVYDIRSMLDVPFFLDDRVGGVICCENQYENKNWSNEDVDFAKSVADLITVAFKSAHSRKLLDESQQLSEELRAQEEEIRQNMEELSATQDELQRHLKALETVTKEFEIREHVFGHTVLLSESDQFGTITNVNDKLCMVSGYSREELIGRPHNLLRHPDMPSVLFARLWSSLKSGDVFTAVIKNRRKDGTAYWVDATVVPVKDDDGKVVKYISTRYHLRNESIALSLYEEQALRLNLPLLIASRV